LKENKMSVINRIFKEKVSALGSDATESQGAILAQWIIDNLDQEYWMGAAEYASDIPGVYTEISMRCGECGIFI
jgi:hypothetical protein